MSLLAVGTEQIGRPLLLTMDGQPAGPISDRIQLLLNDQRALAQVDLSVPGRTVVDVRFAPDVQRAKLFDLVSRELAATGPTIPADRVAYLFDRVLSDETPPWVDLKVPQELVRSIASKMAMHYHEAFDAQGSPGNAGHLDDADSATEDDGAPDVLLANPTLPGLEAQRDEPTAAPESVLRMASWLDTAATEVDTHLVPMHFIARLFPIGLRETPADDAETMPVEEWVRARYDGDRLDGVHQLSTWHELKTLVRRVGENGPVLTSDRLGQDLTVYTLTDGDIWQVRVGAEPVLWQVPPDLPTTPEPPRMVLAFTKCADPI
jgi:hypothetical protein